MECINHPGTAAAGTCKDCGKALCASCVNRFSSPICMACLIQHNRRISRHLYAGIVMTIVVFFAIFFAMAWIGTRGTSDIESIEYTTLVIYGLTYGLMGSCIYWGWKFLGPIPIFVYFMGGRYTGIVLLAVGLVRLVMALFIGVFVAPWQIYKGIKTIRENAQLEKNIASGNA